VSYNDISGLTKHSVYATRTLPRMGIVMHSTDGVDSVGWLTGRSADAGTPASADFLIRRNGDILRLVGFGYYAFHAGKCQYGQYRDWEINQRFFGIELENADSKGESPTQAQYDALGALVTELIKQKELPVPYVVLGHGEIAEPAGRRNDPRRFDWNRIIWPR
jgi:N-acetyl-anhydromuramyl-L-alanine amidase AmpD